MPLNQYIPLTRQRGIQLPRTIFIFDLAQNNMGCLSQLLTSYYLENGII